MALIDIESYSNCCDFNKDSNSSSSGFSEEEEGYKKLKGNESESEFKIPKNSLNHDK